MKFPCFATPTIPLVGFSIFEAVNTDEVIQLDANTPYMRVRQRLQSHLYYKLK